MNLFQINKMLLNTLYELINNVNYSKFRVISKYIHGLPCITVGR